MAQESFDIMHEIAPKVLIPIEKIGFFDISITNTVVTMLVATTLAAIVLIVAARRVKLVPGRFQSFVETLVEFVRDDIAVDMIGKEGIAWYPFLAALFFFILFNNVLGMIPGASTPTGRISVPAVLAIIVFLTVHGYGVFKHGPIKYFASWVPGGLPVWLWPVVFLLEAISALAKPLSLTVRLFANMLADKIVVVIFVSFAIMFKTLYVSPVSVPLAIVASVLELLFSVIQAYVFTVLSAMYIGAAVHPEH